MISQRLRSVMSEHGVITNRRLDEVAVAWMSAAVKQRAEEVGAIEVVKEEDKPAVRKSAHIAKKAREKERASVGRPSADVGGGGDEPEDSEGMDVAVAEPSPEPVAGSGSDDAETALNTR